MQSGKNQYDLNSTINASTASVDVEALSKKGIQKVRVINKHTILQLIDEAVQRIISTKTDLLTTQQKEEILRQSKAELDRLIKDQQLSKNKVDLVEQDKNDLVKELMNLNEQVRVMQNLHQEETARRFEEGAKSLEPAISALNEEVTSLKAQIEEQKNSAENKEQMNKQFADMLAAQKLTSQGLREEIRSVKEESSIQSFEEIEIQLEKRYEEGVKSQFSAIENLKERNQSLAQKHQELEKIIVESSDDISDQLTESYEEGVRSQAEIISGLNEKIGMYKQNVEEQKTSSVASGELSEQIADILSSQSASADNIKIEIASLKNSDTDSRDLVIEKMTDMFGSQTDLIADQNASASSIRSEIMELKEALNSLRRLLESQSSNKDEVGQGHTLVIEQIKDLSTAQKESSLSVKTELVSMQSKVQNLNDLQAHQGNMKQGHDVHAQRFDDVISSQRISIDSLKAEIRSLLESSTRQGSHVDNDSQLQKRFQDGIHSQQSIIDELRSERNRLEESERKTRTAFEQCRLELNEQRLEVEHWVAKFNSIKSLFT